MNKPLQWDKRSVIFLSNLSAERFLNSNKPGVSWSGVAFSVVQAYVASALCGGGEGGRAASFIFIHSWRWWSSPWLPHRFRLSYSREESNNEGKNKKERGGKKHQSVLLSTSKLEAFWASLRYLAPLCIVLFRDVASFLLEYCMRNKAKSPLPSHSSVTSFLAGGRKNITSSDEFSVKLTLVARILLWKRSKIDVWRKLEAYGPTVLQEGLTWGWKSNKNINTLIPVLTNVSVLLLLFPLRAHIHLQGFSQEWKSTHILIHFLPNKSG